MTDQTSTAISNDGPAATPELGLTTAPAVTVISIRCRKCRHTLLAADMFAKKKSPDVVAEGQSGLQSPSLSNIFPAPSYVPLLDHVPGTHDFSKKSRAGIRPQAPSAESALLSNSCNVLFLAYDVQDPDVVTANDVNGSNVFLASGKKAKKASGKKKTSPPVSSTLLSDLIPSLLPAVEGEQDGRIDCPNARCGAKLGSWAWAGAQCSCGTWVTPGFAVQKGKVDITYGGGLGMVERTVAGVFTQGSGGARKVDSEVRTVQQHNTVAAGGVPPTGARSPIEALLRGRTFHGLETRENA
ncbi:hypothetical protein M427DRAFT_54144 [Gonapodya prolifera JEL478]|uniref:Uncharacterized protein n=1 Tax=Gonapodya prolifera (strain JEL478) TaxID=1344416 RepID=A0A139AM98_GONPJ|nr:hypothetical protein M427DRAFT_54144 [Gonapodya prolifera JEL478]|eukprot:KXS17897.1 hypothetical protein M427DRAFT_54144 [Gonapodya prolifera JEL478]